MSGADKWTAPPVCRLDAAVPSNLLQGFLRFIGIGDVVDRHIGPGMAQGDGLLFADAGTGDGDQSLLAQITRLIYIIHITKKIATFCVNKKPASFLFCTIRYFEEVTDSYLPVADDDESAGCSSLDSGPRLRQPL